MASRIDPFGLADVATATVRTGFRLARWGERQALGLLRSRLDASVPATGQSEAEPSPEPGDLAEKMDRLLNGAYESSGSSGRQELFGKILDQLVPDEARIIGALSDGSPAPSANVYAGDAAGSAGEVVLEHATLVGRRANLSLPQLAPTYISHLLALGLVETGPEDGELEDDYALLAADTSVQRALKRAGQGPLAPRVERHTLRLSGLGLELWAASNQPSRG